MIGIDILKVSRFRKSFSDRFRERVFSEKEQSYCEARRNKMLHYAVRFAAKEAVIKALRNPSLDLKRIEVLNKNTGAPYVRLAGSRKKISISLSHEHDYVVAVAVEGKTG